MKFSSFTTALGLGLPLATAAPANSWGSQCQVMNFTVSGTAQNRNITGIDALLGNTTAFLAAVTADLFPKITVSGNQTLSGVYCPPKGWFSLKSLLESH